MVRGATIVLFFEHMSEAGAERNTSSMGASIKVTPNTLGRVTRPPAIDPSRYLKFCETEAQSRRRSSEQVVQSALAHLERWKEVSDCHSTIGREPENRVCG